MNLEINEALDQFRRWRDHESRVLFTGVQEGKSVNWLCRIAEVGVNALLVGRVGEAHTFKIRRLKEADFSYADSREAAEPEKAAAAFVCSIEIAWPSGESCRFLEIVDNFVSALDIT